MTYLIQHVTDNYSYDDYSIEREYKEIGYVETEELARKICNTYGLGFEYKELKLYNNVTEIFKEYVRWENALHLTLCLKTKEVNFEVYSNPDYIEEVCGLSYYRSDLSGRNQISLSIHFNTEEEITKFNEDVMKYFIKHIFASGETDKTKTAKSLLSCFADEVKSQYNINLYLPKDFGLQEYGKLLGE